MTEDSLIAVRKQKHQELNGGVYPVTSNTSECIHDVKKRILDIQPPISIDSKELMNKTIIHGRIVAIRKSGGITFIKVTDVTGSLQLIASKNVLSNYDKLRLLDLADIVEIEGLLCMSKTHEPSVLITNWVVLTKSHRAPPEKFTGLTNQEMKYRKRYLDLMSSDDSRSKFIIRSYIIRAIRTYMDTHSFIEVETSTLNTIASGANAKPFITHSNSLDTQLSLRIAPELYLKRLLVGGLDKIYEIGRNYRNEGIDTRHNPEFTMMEVYEAYGNFSALITFTKSLLLFIDQYLKEQLPSNVINHYNECVSTRTYSWESSVEVPMWDAVKFAAVKAGIEIDSTIDPYTHESVTSNIIVKDSTNQRLTLIDMAGLNDELSRCTNNGEKIGVLFEYLAEPFLVEDYRDGNYSCPVYITQYPKSISPLARAMDQYPTLCDRFELFVDGRELANAFQELNDPDEQSLRFRDQLTNNNKDPMAYDSDYIEALEYGMPPATGLGIGIDRLVMLLTNTTAIRDVILFPALKQR